MNRIEQIEARLTASTKGPWALSEPHWRKGWRGRNNRQSITSPHGTVAVVFKAQWGQPEYHSRNIESSEARGETLERVQLDSPDGPLIANATSDLRYLLDLVRTTERALLLACDRVADSPQSYEEARTPEGWADYFMDQAR